MGVRLFNLTTRSVTPSEAGEKFTARVRPALSEITAALTVVNKFRNESVGPVRLNAADGAARMVLEPLVLEFLRRYPLMRVDLVTEGRLVDVVAEGFDGGIRRADHVPLDIVALPCSPPARFIVVGAPVYFQAHPQPRLPSNLRAHP